MRIAYLITHMGTVGGAQIHVSDLSCWLKQHNHEVVVLTGSKGFAAEQLSKRGLAIIRIADLVHPINPLRDYRAVQNLRAALREIEPDLLSCHSSKAGIVGRAAAHFEKVPVVFTAHGWAFEDGVPAIQRHFALSLERTFSHLADRIVTVSEFGKALALARRVAPADKITAIHNGMPYLNAAVRPGENMVPRIAMIARFANQKDHATLVAALARLRDLPWELHFIGGGNAETCIRQIADLGITDRVTLHGECANAGVMLDEMDVFALISKYEGFPRSILEAMRAAKPVIATDVGGVSEAVIDGKTGFLVPPQDVEATAAKLRTMLCDRNIRQQFGAEGRKRYLENFTFLHMAQRTLELYEDVLLRARSNTDRVRAGERKLT